MSETKTRIIEGSVEIVQTRRCIVDFLIRPADGSQVVPDGRWEVRAEIRNDVTLGVAVDDYIKRLEYSPKIARALLDARWDGSCPIIVECSDGYMVKLAVAQVSIKLV